MRLDQVCDALLDVGPDGVVLQVRHVGHRHHHRQVERLGRRGRHDGGPSVPRQEPRHLFGRPNGGRQSDALRGPLRQAVQALQRQREVRAALCARDGVNLVDDHGLYARQRVASGRGQHQKQRLRCGDQDIRRVGDQLAPPTRGSVTGADADADLRVGKAEPLGRTGDAGEWCA